MKFCKDYSAGIVLSITALMFMALHAYGVREQHADWVTVWITETAENLQSEMWQVLAAALVFKFLLFKGAPESKDTEE